MPREKLDFGAVRDMAIGLPGVEESSMHGQPSLKLRGKVFACPALHKSADPESLVVRIGLAERAKLMKAEPDTYYVTPHYSKYPMVLVRLSHINRTSLGSLLEKAWVFGGGIKGPVRSKPSKAKRRVAAR